MGKGEGKESLPHGKMTPRTVRMNMPNPLDRKEQLEVLRQRYARRNKQGRARMLDEMCEQYDYDRKHAIKLLGDALPKPTGSPPPGPQPKYQPIAEPLGHIWQVHRPLGTRTGRPFPWFQ